MVDMTIFHPAPKEPSKNRPIMLYVGPILKSRNLEAFLKMPFHGLKRLIGDGKDRLELSHKYPYAEFILPLDELRLARAYAQSDVFVYPCDNKKVEDSMIQALACGVPIAGFPTDLMVKVIDSKEVGCYHATLTEAIKKAMQHVDMDSCVRRAHRLV